MELTKTYSDIAEYGEKYHFYHNAETGTVVCTTLYKGQIIRGVAKCNPDDNFDLAVGKRLAHLRCKQKFIQKKVKRAHMAHVEAIHAEAVARDKLYQAYEFVNDTEYQLELATNELDNLERELGIIN